MPARMSHEPDTHTLPRLGRYLLLRPLGSGGMAETFVAVRACPERPDEPEPGEPEVCLKRLRAELAEDPVQRGHFADEARTLARLCHPNVAALLDVGPDHVVTELIDGVDLRRLLKFVASRGERLPEPLVVRIARELADALAHAHARGVVHRDVTPANVVVGRGGEVTLVDFGIARSDAQKQRTRTGLVKGKAPYMAPEQALGAPIDARADLFALGVVLFEVLVGARPHDGASDLETLRRAMRGERRSWGEPPPEPGLRALVERLLSPDPRDRPASADAVRRDLASLSCGEARDLGAWARAAADAPTPRERDGATRAQRAATRETATFLEAEIPTREEPAVQTSDVASSAPVAETLEVRTDEVRTAPAEPATEETLVASSAPVAETLEVRTDEVRTAPAEPATEETLVASSAPVAETLEVRTDEVRTAPAEPANAVCARVLEGTDGPTEITERLPWGPMDVSSGVGPLTPAGALTLGVLIGGSAGAVAAALWHWLA
ncbi:MAG: hypothetical protein OHK0013_14410 [Sandaracinaceae bacterium]